MTNGQTGWLLLVLFAWMMILIGVQGNLGVTIAILFCPSEVSTTEGGNVINPVIGGLTAATNAANSAAGAG